MYTDDALGGASHFTVQYEKQCELTIYVSFLRFIGGIFVLTFIGLGIYILSSNK